MRKTLLALLVLGCIASCIFSVSAGGPVFWRINTRAEVEKGDAQGVSIADNGTLTLAPALAGCGAGRRSPGAATRRCASALRDRLSTRIGGPQRRWLLV